MRSRFFNLLALLSAVSPPADCAGSSTSLARRLLGFGHVWRLTAQEAAAYRPKGFGTVVAVEFNDEHACGRREPRHRPRGGPVCRSRLVIVFCALSRSDHCLRRLAPTLGIPRRELSRTGIDSGSPLDGMNAHLWDLVREKSCSYRSLGSAAFAASAPAQRTDW